MGTELPGGVTVTVGVPLFTVCAVVAILVL